MEINGKHTKLPEGTTILDYLEQNHYVLSADCSRAQLCNFRQRRLCKSCFEG